MKSIKEMEIELSDLRSGTLNEFKEVAPQDMDAQKFEEWENRNSKMAELVDAIKEAKKYENQKADLEANLEKGQAIKEMPIHTEAKEEAKSLGGQLMDSKAYNAFIKEGQKNITSELKFDPRYEFKSTLVSVTKL